MGYKKPGFFLAGAAKSGTTSIQKYLAGHPDIYFSPIKEPNFFSIDIDPVKFNHVYRKNTPVDPVSYFKNEPLKELHLAFIRDEKHYKQLFENSSDYQIVAEFSTSYLFSTEAASEISVFNPEAKIAFILRNPVERAFSHYLMAQRFGYTTRKFLNEIEHDFSKKEKGWGISNLYIELGMYYEQLKRYYDTFPASQLKVFLFEELINDPQKLINELCDFLGISHYTIKSAQKFNEGQIARFGLVNKIFVQSGLKKVMMKMVPESMLNRFRKVYFSKNNLPELSEEERKYLYKFFREDIQKTSTLIGKDLSGWML